MPQQDTNHIPLSSNPVHAEIIANVIRRKYGSQKDKTDEQKILEKLKPILLRVGKTVEQILRALPTPAAYDRNGTADIIASILRAEFHTWSKEDLAYLCLVFNTSQLMSDIDMMVHQGLVGEHKDEPI